MIAGRYPVKAARLAGWVSLWLKSSVLIACGGNSSSSSSTSSSSSSSTSSSSSSSTSSSTTSSSGDLAPLANGLCAANTGLGLGSGAKRNPCVVLDNGTAGCFHDDFAVSYIRYSDGSLVDDATGITNGSFGDQGEFCFVTGDGALFCGTQGQARSNPEIASGVISAGRLGIGADYCAIANNQLLCGTPGSTPQAVLSPAATIKSLGCYKEACCVVLDDGNLECSSGNQNLLSRQGTVSFFAGGDNNRCAVYDDGRAICDGENWNGQLGLPGYSPQDQTNPAATFDEGMVATACGQHSACWLAQDGTVWCSGAGSNEAGSGGGERFPTMIKTVSGEVISNAVAITSGREFSCAALANGGLTCWGFGSHAAKAVDLEGAGVRMPAYCRE